MNSESLGQRLRRHRRAAKKTLQQVAAEAGVTAGFLSQAERDLTGVSLSSLAAIALALGVPLKSLFEQPVQARPDSHQGERAIYATADLAPRYERLSSRFPGSTLNAVKMRLPVGYRSERVSHAGEELVYVLAGRAVYTVAGVDYPLGPGDSLHFDAHQPHELANAGDKEAELISIGTMAIFDDGQAT